MAELPFDVVVHPDVPLGEMFVVDPAAVSTLSEALDLERKTIVVRDEKQAEEVRAAMRRVGRITGLDPDGNRRAELLHDKERALQEFIRDEIAAATTEQELAENG